MCFYSRLIILPRKQERFFNFSHSKRVIIDFIYGRMWCHYVNSRRVTDFNSYTEERTVCTFYVHNNDIGIRYTAHSRQRCVPPPPFP